MVLDHQSQLLYVKVDKYDSNRFCYELLLTELRESRSQLSSGDHAPIANRQRSGGGGGRWYHLVDKSRCRSSFEEGSKIIMRVLKACYATSILSSKLLSTLRKEQTNKVALSRHTLYQAC